MAYKETRDEGGSVSTEPNKIGTEGAKEEQTYTEQIEIAASELVNRTKELIEERNVRRLIIRNPDDEDLVEVPLTAGVAVGGVVTLIAPVLAALGQWSWRPLRLRSYLNRSSIGH